MQISLFISKKYSDNRDLPYDMWLLFFVDSQARYISKIIALSSKVFRWWQLLDLSCKSLHTLLFIGNRNLHASFNCASYIWGVKHSDLISILTSFINIQTERQVELAWKIAVEL